MAAPSIAEKLEANERALRALSASQIFMPQSVDVEDVHVPVAPAEAAATAERLAQAQRMEALNAEVAELRARSTPKFMAAVAAQTAPGQVVSSEQPVYSTVLASVLAAFVAMHGATAVPAGWLFPGAAPPPHSAAERIAATRAEPRPTHQQKLGRHAGQDHQLQSVHWPSRDRGSHRRIGRAGKEASLVIPHSKTPLWPKRRWMRQRQTAS